MTGGIILIAHPEAVCLELRQLITRYTAAVDDALGLDDVENSPF